MTARLPPRSGPDAVPGILPRGEFHESGEALPRSRSSRRLLAGSWAGRRASALAMEPWMETMPLEAMRAWRAETSENPTSHLGLR